MFDFFCNTRAALDLAHVTWILTDSVQQAPNQPRIISGNYLPNGGAAHSGPAPGAVPLLPNQGRVIQQGSVRVLCIADVRGEQALSVAEQEGISDSD
jgi:hypothetical protein